MPSRTVLIADHDIAFTRALTDELQTFGGDLIPIVCDTRQKAAQSLIEQHPSLVVAERELLPHGALAQCKIVMIADKPESAALTIQRQNPAHAAQTIFQALNHRTRVIGVSSPSGGAGKTSVCVGLCAAAARRQKRAFYFSLESMMGYNPYARVINQGFDKVIEQLDDDLLLYDALQRGICRSEKGGVMTFVPGEHMVDRDELTGDEIESLIRSLVNLCCLDDIFVDMESCLDERMMRVWAMAAQIVVVLSAAQSTAEKKRTMYRELEFRQRRDVHRMQRTIEKVMPIINRANPARELTADDLSFGPLKIRHRLPTIAGSDAVSDQKWNSGVIELMNAYFDPIYEEISQ